MHYRPIHRNNLTEKQYILFGFILLGTHIQIMSSQQYTTDFEVSEFDRIYCIYWIEVGQDEISKIYITTFFSISVDTILF